MPRDVIFVRHVAERDRSSVINIAIIGEVLASDLASNAEVNLPVRIRTTIVCPTTAAATGLVRSGCAGIGVHVLGGGYGALLGGGGVVGAFGGVCLSLDKLISAYPVGIIYASLSKAASP